VDTIWSSVRDRGTPPRRALRDRLAVDDMHGLSWGNRFAVTPAYGPAGNSAASTDLRPVSTSARGEHHQRDVALGITLVIGKTGPHRHHLRPQRAFLLTGGQTRSDCLSMAPDLHRG